MTARFIKGLFFGSLLGAAGGLLLAPKKGKETQAELKQYLDESLADVTTLQQDVHHVQENLRQTQMIAQEIIPTFQKELTQSIEDFKFQADPRMARIREQAQTLKTHLEATSLKEQAKS